MEAQLSWEGLLPLNLSSAGVTINPPLPSTPDSQTHLIYSFPKPHFTIILSPLPPMPSLHSQSLPLPHLTHNLSFLLFLLHRTPGAGLEGVSQNLRLRFVRDEEHCLSLPSRPAMRRLPHSKTLTFN